MILTFENVLGINLVRSKDDLKEAISIAFEHSDTIIIEDFIEFF